jgi:hypothetical protein
LPNMRMRRTRSRAFLGCSPVMRSPLGLRRRVSTLASLAFADGAKRPSVQGRCGFRPGKDLEVSEKQARCIARLGGLPKGIGPWALSKQPGEAGEPTVTWHVYSTISDGPCPKMTGGLYMVIDIHDGKILETVAWDTICESEPNH